jgi:hypothetical protein
LLHCLGSASPMTAKAAVRRSICKPEKVTYTICSQSVSLIDPMIAHYLLARRLIRTEIIVKMQ